MVGLRVAVGLLSGALLFGCAHGTVETSQPAPVSGADLGSLGERTSELTGTPLPDEVEADMVLRGEVMEILTASAQVDWPADEASRFAEGLVAVGLWPSDQDLLTSMLEVSSNHVGGFYLPDNRTIYVVDDAEMSFFGLDTNTDAGREFVLTHELIHAHQHASHPELFDFFMSWHSQEDAATAVAAAVEGHALRSAIEVFAGEGRLPTPELVANFFGFEPTGELAEMPAFLRLTHSFPYVRGYPLAYREGSGVLDSAPASTEQVMHEERRNDDFWALDLAAAAEQLPSGCQAVYENTVGELGMSVLFDAVTNRPSPEVWTGWDGDRYMAVRCGDERALLWLTAWDTEADAYEFAQAYGAVAARIAETANYDGVPHAYHNGKAVVVATPKLKKLVSQISSVTRRARVTTLEELRSHFDAI